MKIPSIDTIKQSAISHLRQLNAHEEADLLSRCKLEIADKGQQYAGSTVIGLNITLRCAATDLVRFTEQDSAWGFSSDEHWAIKTAIESVLPAQLKVHDLSARSMLVDSSEFKKSEVERLIEAQIDLMTSVATGGPRIQVKNDQYKERRKQIKKYLASIELSDPNSFEDLWAWYSRWSSGDLPTYQSRRDYVKTLYKKLLDNLAGASNISSSEPTQEPTGWEKVDRLVESIVHKLPNANREEEFQTIGLLCRECLIALAQAVYDSSRHITSDNIVPSKTDAYRMLEAYFSTEYKGSTNETLRKHAKAALAIANELQHKSTATTKHAALCAEATRTVVNIVAITSEKR